MFNMDQIKFLGRNDRNSPSTDNIDVAMKPKMMMNNQNAASTNIFKSNALKNLSKNMAGPPTLQESKDDSFGDYNNDPFEKEARDFINSQLDVRLS